MVSRSRIFSLLASFMLLISVEVASFSDFSLSLVWLTAVVISDFSSLSLSSWYVNLSRDPRVCISCADDINPEHARVTIEGIAEVVAGPVPLVSPVKEIADEMAIRYMGPDGPSYAAKTANRLRYLVKITPTKITSWRGEWHKRYIVTE